jgi:transcriptional regulator with XRE-family HTH domain
MTGKHADNEKCQQFVANLKRMREALGWSQERLAAESHCTAVAMIESFARSPLPEHGESFDRAFGLTDVFEKAAREIQGEAYPPAFRSFAEEERKATDLSIFEHSLVPGIFQTERYAQAILSTHPNTSEATVRERVAGRLARQEILTREDPPPPHVWALLDEVVLRRRIGDASVMHEQLTRLVELADFPTVRIQVIEGLVGHVGLLGAFAIAERPGRASLVNLEDIADGGASDEVAVETKVRLRFRALQAEALPSRASLALIARMAEDLWTGSAPTGARALIVAPTVGSV